MATSTSHPAVHVELLCSQDMLEGPAAAVVDVLRMLNTLAQQRGARRAPFCWQWTSPEGRAVRRTQPGTRRVARPDVLVVPGWHARNGPHLDRLVHRDRAACPRLAAVHAAGGQVLAVYTGVALLGEARLLDDRLAAVPWPFVTSVRRHAPTVRLAPGDAWTGEDGIWTADSPALTTELVLAALKARGLEGRLGEWVEAARTVLLHSAERQRLAEAVAQVTPSRLGPGVLERARRWLEDHLQEPYSLARAAQAAATSERSLLRHFRAAFGCTPLQMLHGLRVTRARMLLETTYLPVEAIAEQCGWRDVVMLRTAFRRETGMTPAAYRARYQLRADRRQWGRDLPRSGTP
jgi:transcriptional regulator GlxA family with amidase domain